MPRAPSRPCRRCGRLTRDPSGLCEAHQKAAKAEYEAQRQTSHDRGYGPHWKIVRAAKIRAQPFCERCLAQGRITDAWGVHHRDGNPRNNAPENLESVCRRCHEDEHREDRFRPRQAAP